MKAKYNTQQRELILEYIVGCGNSHFTPPDISAHLRERGTPVGKATIYRYLDILVNENVVRKFASGSSAGSCYQYISDQTGCKSHYHLVCTECSSLSHMECTYMDEMFNHLATTHSFSVDPTKTVVYGLCSKCSKERTPADEK